MKWSDERVELLRNLYAEGLSMSQIAHRLGGGVTRNAVIGKAMRIGLHRMSHNSPLARKVTRTPRRKRKIRSGANTLGLPRLPHEDIAHLIRPAADDIPDGGLATRRKNQCCFPIGDPLEPGFGYCREDREIGSYCLSHFLRMRPGAAVQLRPEPSKSDAAAKETEAV